MHDHRKLEVWREGRRLVSAVYLATREFPAEERFGLVRQLRRAALSIPSNIAEGAGRGGTAEFARFLRIAMGSACELETELEVSWDLGYLAGGHHQDLIRRLGVLKRRLGVLELRVRRAGAQS